MEDGVNKSDSHSLLIVDDDTEWTDLLRVFFSKKYSVFIANHADDAIDLIRSNLPRAIILDLVMPSVDGFGLMHRINEMSLGEIPTVLTTGWSSPDVEACATLVGCSAVLCKPISLTELDAVVSSLMSKGEAHKKTEANQPETGEEAQ